MMTLTEVGVMVPYDAGLSMNMEQTQMNTANVTMPEIESSGTPPIFILTTFGAASNPFLFMNGYTIDVPAAIAINETDIRLQLSCTRDVV